MGIIEQGSAKLLSMDTNKKTLKFEEIIRQRFYGSEQPLPKHWEHHYSSEMKDEVLFTLIGKRVGYILSDGVVVNLGH
jgi:hypothetical protein